MLEVLNLTVKKRDKILLRDVSLHVRAGELVAVLGPNGAGKSTLLRAASGELGYQSGAVILNHRPLNGWSLLERARLRALLPQQSSIAFGYTVFETVLLGRYAQAGYASTTSDHQIVRTALEQVDATHLANREMLSLSGGESARVMLARAMAQIAAPQSDQSRFLLLDEPTASLDIAFQHATLEALVALAKSDDVGVMVVMHDVNLAAQYADRIVGLKAGQMIIEGAPGDVLSRAFMRECFNAEAIVIPHPGLECPLVVAGRPLVKH